MIEKNCVRYIVNYAPSEETKKKIVEFQGIFNEKLFNYPVSHCTVFSFDSNIIYEEEIKKTFLKSEYFQPKILLENLSVFHSGVLVVKINKNNILIKNHHISHKELSIFIDKDSDLIKKLGEIPMTHHQKEMYIKYGSPFYGDLYNPHISLGKVSASNGIIREYTDFFSNISWKPGEIILSRKINGEWSDIEKKNF